MNRRGWLVLASSLVGVGVREATKVDQKASWEIESEFVARGANMLLALKPFTAEVVEALYNNQAPLPGAVKGPRGRHQRILIYTRAGFRRQPWRIWSGALSEECFEDIPAFNKNLRFLLRVVHRFFAGDGPAWVEFNPESIPDFDLHPLQGTTSLMELPSTRFDSLPVAASRKTHIEIGLGSDAVQISLRGCRLGYCKGRVDKHTRLIQKAVPRYLHLVSEGLSLALTEYWTHLANVHEDNLYGGGIGGQIHRVPAEDDLYAPIQLDGRAATLSTTRFITLGRLVDGETCQMLGIGFRPSDARIVSFRPVEMSFAVTQFSIPKIVPLMANALGLA